MAVRNKLKAVLVGVGPGASALVTPEAREIISRAEIILGWDMDLLPIRDCVAGKKSFCRMSAITWKPRVRLSVRLSGRTNYWPSRAWAIRACLRGSKA